MDFLFKTYSIKKKKSQDLDLKLGRSLWIPRCLQLSKHVDKPELEMVGIIFITSGKSAALREQLLALKSKACTYLIAKLILAY